MLPEELANLVKLKHLDSSFTHELQTIPLRGLSRLQVLNRYGSHYAYGRILGRDDDGSVVDLLGELECLEQLNDFGISISSVNAVNRFNSSQVFTKCTRYLHIRYCEASTFQLSSTIGNMEKLKYLCFGDCELEELIIDAEVEGANWLLSSVEQLQLRNLLKLKTILPSRGCLQNVLVVDIFNCTELKNVTWVIHLQSLQHVTLQSCYEIEVISDEVEAISQDLIAFPRLKSIYLFNLPKLKSICRNTVAFPSLQSLIVRFCKELKKLPLGLHSTNNTLEEVSGQKEWWDGLEWEDERIKSALLPYFKPW
eukprot:TRINITY_DN3284_c1_g1_i1.p1 TRINITY_DN3284_c1_g1~~TRINITY_DN3284_c1_g1_i1.p1  ORF type:complete len:310 (+),score=31.84 TRINITY_DN3284_c1_g1_i1:452-1381(+)